MTQIPADKQAAARRVAVGFVRQMLVTDDAVGALRSETAARAAVGVAKRQAFWSRNSA